MTIQKQKQKLVLEPAEQGISRALSKGHYSHSHSHPLYILMSLMSNMHTCCATCVHVCALWPGLKSEPISSYVHTVFITVWWRQSDRTGNGTLNKIPLKQHCFHLFSPCVTHLHTKSRDVIEWSSSNWKASMTAMTLSAEERKMLEDSSWPCEAWTAQG